jgi:hypothetical protein
MYCNYIILHQHYHQITCYVIIWNPIHLVHVGTYRYVLVCTDLYYAIVCTGTYYLENVA